MTAKKDRLLDKNIAVRDFGKDSHAEFINKRRPAVCAAIQAHHPSGPTVEGRAGSVGVYIDALPSRIKGDVHRIVPMLAAANIFEEKYESYPVETVSTTLLLLLSLHISRLVHRDEITGRPYVQNTKHEGSTRGSDA